MAMERDRLERRLARERRPERQRRRLQRTLQRAALAAGGPPLDGFGCGTKRAAADVAADADPFSGVRSTTRPCKQRASPALGHGRRHQPGLADHRLDVRARGRQRRRELPRADALRTARHELTARHRVRFQRRMHDLPFDELEGESGCTTEEEAEQCRAELICLAAAGYDGPSGVGTPTARRVQAAGADAHGGRTDRRQHRWRASVKVKGTTSSGPARSNSAALSRERSARGLGERNEG